jgi:hypothetical protein
VNKGFKIDTPISEDTQNLMMVFILMSHSDGLHERNNLVGYKPKMSKIYRFECYNGKNTKIRRR